MRLHVLSILLLFAVCPMLVWAVDGALMGRVLDPDGRAVPGATLTLARGGKAAGRQTAGADGGFHFEGIAAGAYDLEIAAAGFSVSKLPLTVLTGQALILNPQFGEVQGQAEAIVVNGQSLEPTVDLRNREVFDKTLFTRDDQVLQQLAAGINAGQHEGGGKSLEIRRFGFNLDHGGVNGGLKVMVDNVQQNQGTQGHGQGYLGSLKALSPELIEDVTILNGPFSPEYGDFSGLGVVHIRQREALADPITIRLQGGNFHSGRGFFGYSPNVQKTDAYVAYEGSYTDGPFDNPGQYRRDNVNANYTRHLGERTKLGLRLLLGRNNFYSSGQVPLDLVNAGQLDRFGYLDPSLGGRVKLGTFSSYYDHDFRNGGDFRVDGFVSRSLFDLYSNFTFYLNDPVNGDAFQQHDSRLQEGLNARYSKTHRLGRVTAVFLSGANFHDNQINVGLYPRIGREPIGVTTRANAHVTNGATYAQETVSLYGGQLLLGGGIRFDEFRYDLRDRLDPAGSGVQSAGRWQGKGNLAFTPLRRLPITFHANYGRGINSIDARGVVQRPELPRLATTDFYQVGMSYRRGRWSASADAFRIDHSNEQVYIPDDGSYELKGPSRAYGYELKTSFALTRHLSVSGGMTKVTNAYYRGGETRVYVDSAPHFVANGALTLSGWKGWSGSLRMRAINHYRLDGEDPSILAAGHAVWDMSLVRRLTKRLDLNLALDNLLNRSYYETQNYFESRTEAGVPSAFRIHGTPGYPLTVAVAFTLRLGAR